ncbi:MAG TPA: histidine kinase dimerization/phospho-acceptor domain-containing protein, partial [Polyangiaceae bacterium]|nr:histidine kinase dimerization/phospho-acceptor domain-containing protein [Polyangiaceae bacterium]
MIEWLLILGSSVGLILFVAFVAARLLRSRRAGLSIRMQIFLALAGIVGAFALSLGVLVVDRVNARAALLAEESARSEASAVASLVESEMEIKGKTLPEVARDFGSMGEEVRMTLLGRDGEPVLGFDTGDANKKGVVVVTSPILVRGERVGAVRVEKPTIVVERMLADFAPSILVVSVVLGSAAALAAALIGRTIASPIEKLSEFAVKVSEGDRRTAPPVAQGREVQRLTHAIDSMRRELEGRPFVEAFAADLSHELKNPVAAIRASAEVLADGALEEPEEAARFVSRIQ